MKSARQPKPLSPKPFHVRLVELAGSRGLTKPAALAKAVGVDRRLAGSWWRGEREPSGVYLGWIIQALDLSMEELVFLVGRAPGVEARQQAERASRERKARALGGGGASVTAAYLEARPAETTRARKVAEPRRPPDE